MRSLSATALACGIFLSTGCKKFPDGGPVTGSVHVVCNTFAGDDVPIASTKIFLPDLEVYLLNTSTSVESAPVKTDLYGRYQFPTQEPGTYLLSWKTQNGWAAGSLARKIVIGSNAKHPFSAEVRPDKDGGLVFGSVTMADDAPAYFGDELFGHQNTPVVGFFGPDTNKAVLRNVRVNIFGQFVMAGVPKGLGSFLQVKSEAAVGHWFFAPSFANGGDLKVPNRSPRIVAVAKTFGGKPVRTVPEGEKVELEVLATDKDADPLSYEWKVLDGNGVITSAGNKATWTMPGFAGKFTLYVLARDSRGGFAMEMVTFETGKKTDSFTGAVVDKITGDPIKNVDITVGGSSTTTDVTGYFRVEAPLTDRYVLNMTKRGYALRSCIVYADLSGQRWGMVATKDTLFDPTRELVLVDNRAILKKKERRGATVRVPADALVDASGNKPTGMLTGSIATYDITDSESPGDWGAIDEFGKEKNLLSYGAAWVEFMDAAGTKFNLAPGREAEVDMPGPGGMMASGPATSKFWRYDEKDGYWKVSGKSVRKPFGYVGRIDHFSAVNSDVESTNPACMKILIYPDIPTGSQLRLKDATGTNISQCFDLFGLQAGLNAVYRLPPNIDLTLELYTASGTAISDFVVQVDFVNQPGHVANTGPPMPAGADWWPPEPYETCKLVVLLRDVVTSGRQFLTINGRDGGLNAVQNEAQTQAYYNGIDPNHERETLGAWWTKNGFVFGAGTNQPPTNADVRRTSYLNYNDLGSGRDMYFRPLPGGNVAAYVTNYGAFDQDPDNARAAAVNDPAKRGATVCMEFSPVEGRGAGEDRSIVKFYVYKPIPGDPEWAHDIRATSANLDTYGEKFVPNLCINCHGEEPYNLAIGAVPTFEDLDVAASFRELDYATYKFRLDDGATHPTLAEQQAFKDQNLIIRNAGSAIASQPIKDLITGWYASGTPAQDNSYTPPNWIGAPQQGLYHDVVATSCRTCHIALQEDLNWNEYSEFELGNAAFNLRYTVLCEGRYMPHAAITYRNFWLSAVPHRPEELRTFQKLPDWPRIGQCDAP